MVHIFSFSFLVVKKALPRSFLNDKSLLETAGILHTMSLGGGLLMTFCFRPWSRQVSLPVSKSSLTYHCHRFYKSIQKHDLAFQGFQGRDKLF